MVMTSERVRQATEKCSYCGGSIISDDGERKCMSCGRTASAASPSSTPTPMSWTDAAILRLKVLIRQVASVDGPRKEAEQIKRALGVAEVLGVPDLPWKAGSKTGGGATRFPRVRTFPSCSQCGKQFTVGTQYAKQEDGTAICRKDCTSQAEAVKA